MKAVRGFAKWDPKPETLKVIVAVKEVLAEYEAYLPLSLRQVFYRLVAAYGYEKTERAYTRLGTYVAKARRAQLLSFDAIRDDQGKPTEGYEWPDARGFWSDVEERFDHFRRERMNGQPVRIEVWSEAGMTDALFRVAGYYGIKVYSSRGFASVTNAHAVAERALEADVPTALLHVGDHDPSGVAIFESLTEDAFAFLAQKRAWKDESVIRDGKYLPTVEHLRDAGGPNLIPVRVALTEEQIDEYEVEMAPPKPSDSRSANWIGETAQAEALPPDTIATILRQAIEDQLDLDRFEEEKAKEEADRKTIGRGLASALSKLNEAVCDVCGEPGGFGKPLAGSPAGGDKLRHHDCPGGLDDERGETDADEDEEEEDR